ncbi:MAG TPA: hypothetical protein VGO43_10415 [Pyrinomonadaceae bacterium]|jgi:hypothetical protein|nr:hypothetical protein [Pyrinomonadaceae bacterium]
MKKRTLVFALATIVAITQAAAAQKKFETYVNDRFKYTIDYPSDLLTPQDLADNGDGRIFSAPRKAAELYVWGQYNALGRTLKYEYLKDQKGRTVTYKVIFADSYVIARLEKGTIYYQKTMLIGKDGAEDATFATFVIKYPAKQKAKFDPIVRRLVRSFKFT